MKPAVVKRLRLLVSLVSVLVLVCALGAGWFYSRLRASLPVLTGRINLPGLSKTTLIERDAQGVPTIRGTARADVARALGFLHAQDRFFQMDLARRRPAGELSALFGKAAIEADKRARVHGFRHLAETVLAQLSAEQRMLLEAYSAGVNTGLEKLGAPPFEYIVLRSKPRAWKPEDSILLFYAMTLDLQDDRGGYEQSLAAVRDVLGHPALAYFAPLVGPDDAAIDGSAAPLSPMPTAATIDLRTQTSSPGDEAKLDAVRDDSVSLGSNAFALAGTRTANGGALVADDMHLTLRIPNIWYRASLEFPDAVSGKPIRLTGVTLPGLPLMIAGSNGRVAWGFSNADADISDIVVIDQSTLDRNVYIRGKELLQIEKRKETIEVRGGDSVTTEVSWTVFGPIVGRNAQNHLLALKWTMDDPLAANFEFIGLESASSVEEAMAIAHRSGIPNQNIVVADRSGKIGWTICGKLPKRLAFDGRLPVTWTYGDRGWDGFVSENDVPTVVAPEAGQIWTANQRILDSEALLTLGDGGYERPQRAARIRDRLTEVKKGSAADLLDIQLDTAAPYLDRWHALLEKVLSPGAINQKSDRGPMRAALEPWNGRADVDSVSYRLVRRFRQHVVTRVFTPIFERCVEVYPDFSYRRFHLEAALWDMVEKRPPHLLNPAFTSWDGLFLAAADDVLAELDHEHISVERATWGQSNRARIQHPFAHLSQLAAFWLSLPDDSLPGDYDTPRVQAPDDGASERFVVSPGREEEGIFEMPGGESAHPLSPFFKAGHDAWVKGLPTPFLPGKTMYSLELVPAQ